MASRAKVFIGSSVQSLPIAYAIQSNLDYVAEGTVWDQGMFDLNVNMLTNLLEKLPLFDYAIFVFAPEDIALMRNQVQQVVRDNVLFEYGLATGICGQDRTFFVCPKQPTIQLPTDLLGTNTVKYDSERADAKDGNFQPALGPFCEKVRQTIVRLKIRPKLAENPIAHIVEQDPADLRTILDEHFERIKAELKSTFEPFYVKVPGQTTIIEAMDNIDGSIVERDLNKLVQEGRLDEAEVKAKKLVGSQPKDLSLTKSYIGVLLQRDDPKKVVLASDLLLSNSQIKDLAMFNAVSYKLWKVGKCDKAIDVAEKALAIAESENDQERIVRFKGNLAYYYADLGKKNYETVARSYAMEVHTNDPTSAARLDTLGYVKIVFGTKEEVYEGMRLCQQAFELTSKDGKTDGAPALRKAIDKAMQRLSEEKPEDDKT